MRLSTLPLAIAFLITAAATVAHADVTEHWVAVDQVSVQNEINNEFNKPQVAISGVLQGASSATARTYSSSSGFGSHETLARCEKLALLALARPGRYALLIVRHDNVRGDGSYTIKACRLSRVN